MLPQNFFSKCYPHPWKGDKNVVISGMHKWKGDENVVISGMHKWKGDKNVISSMQKLKCHENVEISLGLPQRRWWGTIKHTPTVVRYSIC